MKLKWTKETIQADALRFTSYPDWRRDQTSYRGAVRLGILDDVSQHFTDRRLKGRVWTEDVVRAEAARFTRYDDFRAHCPGALAAAKNWGILREITQHMPSQKSFEHSSGKKQAILDFIDIYGRRPRIGTAFFDEPYESTLGNALHNYMNPSNPVFDPKFRKLIKSISEPNNAGTTLYWDEERCIESARKFQFKGDWSEQEGGAYNAARRGGWLEQCQAHMPDRTGSRRSVINLDTEEVFPSITAAAQKYGGSPGGLWRALASQPIRPYRGLNFAFVVQGEIK